MWLDRGELEKLIELSTRYAGSDRGDDDSDWVDDRRGYGAPPAVTGQHPQANYPPPHHPPPGQYPPKKKEGFFGRLFDFE